MTKFFNDTNKIRCRREFNADAARTEKIQFNIKDDKGRELGAVIKYGEVTYVDDEDGYSLSTLEGLGTWVTVRVEASRNGAAFGATQTVHHFRTMKEAQSKAVALVAGTRKRYEKKFG